MCGIAGVVKFSGGIRMEQLKSMTDAIIHRGPDGEGHWINESSTVGFGHRRLSIIDLSEGGHQPMHYLGRYSITFNGEIYNYVELKKDLQTKGYVFKSESDTEVLLALFAQKGKAMLSDLDGMFSFAIWDNEEQSLFCARDRFGEKPFFYFKDEKQFVFASEMKELWAYGIPKHFKEDRIYDYIQTGIVETQKTIDETYYQGIKKLDASHSITLSNKGEFEVSKYWSLDSIKVNKGISFTEASEEYYNLFKNSINIRLRSDVAVGSSLSGGLDSSSIVKMIDEMKEEGQVQKVFSARFKNFSKDEGEYIEEVVKSCKNVEAFSTWPAEGSILDIIEKVAFHQEEPFASSSILAQWKVMELAKQNNVTVLLDGQGADEYLAGYMPEYKTYLTQLFFEDKSLYEEQYKMYQLNYSKTYPLEHYTKTETMRMKVGRFKKKLLNQPAEYDRLKDRLKHKLTSSGLKELLRYADRNSMAHSREIRLPFLSHKLIEFAFTLPDEFLLKDGWTKYIHRKSLVTHLPPKICWRVDKLGYEPPQQKWLEDPVIKEIIKSQQNKYKIPESSMKVGSYTNSMDWKLLMTSYFSS